MKRDDDPVREAREARERILQDWRERIDRLNEQLGKTRAFLAKIGKSLPAERARAEKAYVALRVLKERSLCQMRLRVEQASEAVRIAELVRLKAEVADALTSLQDGATEFERLTSASPAERMAALRACTEAANQVLGRAHALSLRADDDARGSQAAIRRCTARIEEALAKGDASGAADADAERGDLERFLMNEETHALEARQLHQLLSERKERVLALLQKRAPGSGTS